MKIDIQRIEDLEINDEEDIDSLIDGVDQLYEESMFIILERISKEAKKLPKDEHRLLLQKLADLTRDYDFFRDSIDDRGLKLKY